MPAWIVDKKPVFKDETIESTLVNLGNLFEEKMKDSDSSKFTEQSQNNVNVKDFDSLRFLEKTNQNTNMKDFDSSLIAKTNQHVSERDSDSSNSVSGHKDDGEAELEQCGDNIVIDRVRAVTIKVPIEINGLRRNAVIDTGAEVTVLKTELFYSIPENKRPKLQKPSRNLVVAEQGRKMDTSGIASFDVKLGKKAFKWEIYVAPIGDDVLLGCDVVDELDITINSRQGIQIDGDWLECQVKRKTDDNIARVILNENTTIPANTEVILFGVGINSEKIDTRYSVLQPVIEDERNLLVAHTFIDPFEKVIPVRIANLEEHPIKLRRITFLEIFIQLLVMNP